MVKHSDIDHDGVTGVPAAEAFTEAAHDLHDHTGITGVGGGSESWADVMTDLAATLVHRWTYEEASGAIEDQIGALDLTPSGGTTTYAQASPLGNGVRFAGGVAQAAGDGSMPTGDAARTLIAVARANAANTTNMALLGYGTSGSARQWFAVKQNDGGTVGNDSIAVWSDDHAVPQRSFSDGRWHMIAAGYDSERRLHYYQDGMLWTKPLGGDLNTGTTVKFKTPYDTTSDVIFTDTAVCNTWVGKHQLDRLWRSLAGLL